MTLTQVSTPGIKDGTIVGADLATNIDLSDSQKLRLGNSQDLQLYHNGSNSFIQDQGTGNLYIDFGTSINLRKYEGGGVAMETVLKGTVDGAVELYHNNVKRLETLSDGAKITGKLNLIGDNGLTIEATSTNTAGRLTIIGVNNSNQVSAITRIESVSTDSSSAATATTFSNRNSSNAVNEHMRILSNGRIGIGLTSPTSPLDITGGSDNTIVQIRSTDAGAYLSAIDDTGAGSFGQQGANTVITCDSANSVSSSAIVFQIDANAEKMKLDNLGRLGINHGLSGTADYNRLMVHNPHSGSCWIQLTSTASGSGANSDGLSIGLNTSNVGHIWLRENADLAFATNGTKRMSILAGGGLAFNNDTAQANALDDYEEGTWTPAFNRDTSGFSSLNTSVDLLTYRKIGSTVYISGRVLVGGSNNGANGSVRITLPFAASGGGGDQSGYAHIMVNTHGVNLHNDTVQLFAEISPNNSTMNLHQVRDNANWLAFNSSQLQHNNNEYFGFVGSYVAA